MLSPVLVCSSDTGFTSKNHVWKVYGSLRIRCEIKYKEVEVGFKEIG